MINISIQPTPVVFPFSDPNLSLVPDSLWGTLITRYIFELPTVEVMAHMREDVIDYFRVYWPEYPLGNVVVDKLSQHDLCIIVSAADTTGVVSVTEASEIEIPEGVDDVLFSVIRTSEPKPE